MLLKILDNLIYFLSNIRNYIMYKQPIENEFAWMDLMAEEFEKYSLPEMD